MTTTGKKPAAKPAASPASPASKKAVAGPSISTVNGREIAVLLLIMAALVTGAICLALLG